MGDSSANAERRAIERGWYYVAEPRSTLPEHVGLSNETQSSDPLTRKVIGPLGTGWSAHQPVDRGPCCFEQPTVQASE